ncbi:hypothetical protein CHCC14527_0929 [Bacillus paralicheniformis]|nr:hypothetical protein CHCC14527_0929 [Bacillus paralicheniformis]
MRGGTRRLQAVCTAGESFSSLNDPSLEIWYSKNARYVA